MQKKSILITGCSSGIGYDSACTLHRRGWRVFATCRKKEDCERLRAEGLESFVLDYENPKSITSAVKKVCLLYTSPSPRDVEESRMPSSA